MGSSTGLRMGPLWVIPYARCSSLYILYGVYISQLIRLLEHIAYMHIVQSPRAHICVKPFDPPGFS